MYLNNNLLALLTTVAVQRQVYDRSQLARTFILCMACQGIHLWRWGWENRWYYEKAAEKVESSYRAQSDVETSDEEGTTPGAKMRFKLKRKLRLGARRKLKTAKPVQLKRDANPDGILGGGMKLGEGGQVGQEQQELVGVGTVC